MWLISYREEATDFYPNGKRSSFEATGMELIKENPVLYIIKRNMEHSHKQDEYSKTPPNSIQRIGCILYLHSAVQISDLSDEAKELFDAWNYS